MMLGRIRHRGFSYDEIWSSPTVALGANRLEIVDPQGGRQPAANESEDVFAVLDGEIYNYRELSRLLVDRGHHFRSKCDTEVVVHAFEEWGVGMCDHLRGMFAFALYDQGRDRILLARDPAGVKPLYVGRDPNGALFASSEAKALIGLANSVDLLPPGHLHDGTQCIAYDLSQEMPVLENFCDAAAYLRSLVGEAVRVRVPEDLPFAVFLSSGIDSSLILALAAEARPDVIAITFGLPDSAEVEQATQFCRHLRVRHELIELPFSALLDRYEQVIYHLESFEPNLVRAALITHALCERTRKLGIRVALAGEGADELFGGYNDFLELSEEDLERTLCAFFKDLHRTQLLRWDKMGMAHAVEVRTPFMDRKVVSFGRSLPASYKVRRTTQTNLPITKAVLREAAKDFLPMSVRDRVKIPMDDGVAPDGARQWNDLLSSYFERIPQPTIPKAILESFSITGKEETVNLSILLRYFPLEFISTQRITVRKTSI